MFKWKDEYSVNVKEIDDQHKRLFDLANRIYDLVMLKDDYDHYDEIMTALDELMEYTEYHFSEEEKLMKKYDYDKEVYIEHEIEHTAFVKKIKSMYKKDIDDDQNKILLELLDFVIKWIKAHILGTDKEYTEFFNSKGVY